MITTTATDYVLKEIETERKRQDEKWGLQNYPDGTDWVYQYDAEFFRELCDNAAKSGTLTWRHILREEVYEAFAETDKAKLRAELAQVAAVAVAWIEKLDREM